MALTFPASPTDGQTYTDGDTGRTFKYSAARAAWEPQGGDSAPVFFTTKPVTPEQGQVYYDTATDTLEVYSDTTAAWEKVDAPPTALWEVTANGTTDYIFSGVGFAGTELDPTITVMRGQTYTITNAMGAHPFQIQSTQGLGGTAYNDGVTNNAVSNGTLVWEVRMDAPDTLYYQCTVHAGMNGTINVLNVSAGGASLADSQLSEGEPPTRSDGSTLVAGDIYFEGPQEGYYFQSGTTWRGIGATVRIQTSDPSGHFRLSGKSAQTGDLYINSNDNKLFYSNGTSYQQLLIGSSTATPVAEGAVYALTSTNGVYLGFNNSINTSAVSVNNVVIGDFSGDALTTSSSANAILGNYAGFNLTGKNNVMLGYGSGDIVTSGSGNIILGHHSGISPTADSQFIVTQINPANSTTDYIKLVSNEFCALGFPASQYNNIPNYGTAGQVLTSQGNAAPPTWTTQGYSVVEMGSNNTNPFPQEWLVQDSAIPSPITFSLPNVGAGGSVKFSFATGNTQNITFSGTGSGANTFNGTAGNLTLTGAQVDGKTFTVTYVGQQVGWSFDGL